MNPKFLRYLPILVITLFSVVGSLHAQVSNVSVSPTTLLGDGSYFAAASATVHIPAGNAGGSVYFIPNGNVGGTAAFCSSGRYADQQCTVWTPGPADVQVTFYFNATNYGTTSVSAQIQIGQMCSGCWVTIPLTILGTTSPSEPPANDPDTVCPKCGSGGEPINFLNGNTWITQQDYSMPGLGGGLTLTRTWNSIWPLMNPPEQAGIFGDSWRSSYEERIQVLSGGAVKYWKGNGSSLFFAYTGSGGVYNISAPADDQTTLSFDSSTTLWTLTQKDGTQRIFNNAGYLTSIVDRNGNTITINVDAANQNRIASVTAASGQVLTFNYANASYPRLCTSISDSVGTFTTYNYDFSTGRLTAIVYPDGSQSNFHYSDPNSTTLISSVTDALGKTLEAHTYDSQRRGLTSQQANDSTGHAVNGISVTYSAYWLAANQVWVANSQGAGVKLTISNRAQRHYLIAVDSGGTNCNTCDFSIGSNFGISQTGQQLLFQDAGGNKSTYTYDSQGNMLSKALPTGGTWYYTYNSFGQILTVTDPLGSQPGDPNHTTTYAYDAHGNLTSITTQSPDGIIAPSVTTFTPNAQGQITQIKDPLNNQTTIAFCPTGISNCPYGMIQSVTDAQNDQTTYAYDGRGNRTSVTDANNKTTEFQYDLMNRLTLITYPTTPTTTVQFHYDYRGRRDYVIDQNNNKTTYGYDDADRLISITDAQTPSPGVTTYTYDSENNLTDVYDAAQNHTHFGYVSGHQLQKTTFPSGLYETYIFDALDNLTSRTDRNGNRTTFYYDGLNRLYRKIHVADWSEVDYTYDAASRLTQVTDGSGTYTFGYDNMNRLTSTGVNYTFDSAGNYTVQYGYDAASNRTSMKDPQNLSTTYSYDTLNRLSSLAFNGQNPGFGFGYDLLSRRTSLTRPNGVNTSYNYDSVSRLLSVIHQLGSTTIDGASYTYDSAGNRNSKTDLRTNLTSNYGYDTIYQLLQVTQGASTTESYTYDPVGNRLSSLGVSPYSYNSSNELTSTPTVTYTYDNNGSTKTKSDGTQYTWDYENRLTKVVLPGSGGTVTFKYDPFGRRVQKSFTQGSNTTTTNYLYDGKNLLEEVDSNGSVLARYTTGKKVDEPFAELRSGTTSYYQADGLGSVTSLTNTTGTLINTYSYDSFGNAVATTGTVVNPFRLTAREFDSETGSYYYRARYYDETAGRFLSEDPIGFRAGNNFYDYVTNNPLRYRDPTGLLRDCDQEHIECFRKCWGKCPPWPFGPKGKGGHYRYCSAKCLAEYMECEAENDAERTVQYCSQNPGACFAIAIGAATVAAQPELAPLLPAFF
jgi:RHS repeat-associated protein